MNDEARTALNEILSKEPAALTEDERDFLMARRSYLTEEQKVNYGVTEPSVESSSEDAEASEAGLNPDEAPKKAPKKAK